MSSRKRHDIEKQATNEWSMNEQRMIYERLPFHVLPRANKSDHLEARQMVEQI
jgi:hypothetical protein